MPYKDPKTKRPGRKLTELKRRAKPYRVFAVYKMSAKARGLSFSLSFEECNKLIQSPCDYCGEEPTQKPNGIDRVDNKIGYESENCVSCCSMCNHMKRDFLKEVFIDKCTKIAILAQKK